MEVRKFVVCLTKGESTLKQCFTAEVRFLEHWITPVVLRVLVLVLSITDQR